QHRPVADDAEAIENGEPLGAVGDVGRGTAEERHGSGVRQRRPGHEIDEDFSRRPVEPEKRDALARANGQLPDAKRLETKVILGDGSKLENGTGHDPIKRLTSVTMRLDARSAAISIFSAAR